MEHDIKKLPKWAQAELSKRNANIQALKAQLKGAEQASQIQQMNWFTIGPFMTEKRNLYFLDKDHPNLVATVGAGTVLLIGRPKEETDWIFSERYGVFGKNTDPSCDSDLVFDHPPEYRSQGLSPDDIDNKDIREWANPVTPDFKSPIE